MWAQYFLQSNAHNITIYRNTLTDEGVELVVTVMEAKELIRPANSENLDTFVRIYLVPDETGALQTKVRGYNTFYYNPME